MTADIIDVLTAVPMTAREIAELAGVSKQAATHELKVLVAERRVMVIEPERKRDPLRYVLPHVAAAPEEPPRIEEAPAGPTTADLEVEMVVNFVKQHGPVTRMQVSSELGIDASRVVTILHRLTDGEDPPLRRTGRSVIMYEGAGQ